MNFDKESISEEFLIGCGGGVVGFQPIEIKFNSYLLIFCAHALYKISSSWLKWFSSFNTNKRSNGQERDITANVLWNQVKSHLNMDPKQYSEFQDPISSNSLHIVLTRFFYCNNSKV